VSVAENAKFGSPFAKLGAKLDSGGHCHFTERLGMHRTLDPIHTADLISGAEAVAQGKFSRAMRADELLDSTREIVARGGLRRHWRVRGVQGIGGAHPGPAPRLWESMQEENTEQARLCKTEAYAEGFWAFQEKREPKFFGCAG
jgi:enoyl-CoA hydratase/carnithine racemase